MPRTAFSTGRLRDTSGTSDLNCYAYRTIMVPRGVMSLSAKTPQMKSSAQTTHGWLLNSLVSQIKPSIVNAGARACTKLNPKSADVTRRPVGYFLFGPSFEAPDVSSGG